MYLVVHLAGSTSNEDSCFRKKRGTKIFVIQTPFRDTGTTATWFLQVPLLLVRANSDLSRQIS